MGRSKVLTMGERNHENSEYKSDCHGGNACETDTSMNLEPPARSPKRHGYLYPGQHESHSSQHEYGMKIKQIHDVPRRLQKQKSPENSTWDETTLALFPGRFTINEFDGPGSINTAGCLDVDTIALLQRQFVGIGKSRFIRLIIIFV